MDLGASWEWSYSLQERKGSNMLYDLLLLRRFITWDIKKGYIYSLKLQLLADSLEPW